jgi:hypothetical protein
MITFYPRDIGMWRKVFNFSLVIGTRLPKVKTFHTQDEFFEFLKQHGVKFDDPDNLFELRDYTNSEHPGPHPYLGHNVQTVHQFTVLGWIKRHPI